MEIRDFSAIKAEYITTNMSYRALSEKHGIPITTLSETAKREGWVALRKQARDKAVAEFVEATAHDHAKRALRLNEVADKLLDVIDGALSNIGSDIHPQSLKWYTSALKDIKDIKNIRTELDMREQEARIEKLRREAVSEDSSREIVVTIEGGEEGFAE